MKNERRKTARERKENERERENKKKRERERAQRGMTNKQLGTKKNQENKRGNKWEGKSANSRET